MDELAKIIGAAGCQLIAASGTTAIKTGYKAYALMCRADNTQISSVTKIESDSGATGTVTDESWQNVNLNGGQDFIPLEDPIISITLASGTPSVMAFLEHL